VKVVLANKPVRLIVAALPSHTAAACAAVVRVGTGLTVKLPAAVVKVCGQFVAVGPVMVSPVICTAFPLSPVTIVLVEKVATPEPLDVTPVTAV